MFIDAVEDMPDGVGDDEEGECELEGEVLEGCFDEAHGDGLGHGRHGLGIPISKQRK